MDTRGRDHGATFVNEWSDPDQRCRGLVINPAQFGDGGKQAQRRLRADALDGYEQAPIAFEIEALTDQFQHHPMHLFVFGTKRLKVGHDGLAEFVHPHRAESAGLGMDHVFELVPAAGEFGSRPSRIASSGNST